MHKVCICQQTLGLLKSKICIFLFFRNHYSEKNLYDKLSLISIKDKIIILSRIKVYIQVFSKRSRGSPREKKGKEISLF